MKKNWYAVYTKAQSEKKASQLLTKKRIENFCPLNSVVKETYNNRTKVVYEPLFPNFVFVNITEADIHAVKQSGGDILNFVYWLGKPAVIKTAEIENINQFVNSYYNIMIEKTVVNPSGIVHISNENETNDNKDLKSENIKVSLPSLGYILKAETKKALPAFLRQNYASSKLFA